MGGAASIAAGRAEWQPAGTGACSELFKGAFVLASAWWTELGGGFVL